MNFLGIRKVYMISVHEGTGVENDPHREVKYFFDLEQHGGSQGGMIGKIDPTDEVNRQNQAMQIKNNQ